MVYDRAHSAISEAGPGSFDWDEVFQDVDRFHVSGITPALSQSAADLCLEAVMSAKRRGATVSCDYNFRAKLWKYGKQGPQVMRELVRLVDVGIANEEDCQHSLGIALQGEDARGDATWLSAGSPARWSADTAIGKTAGGSAR